MPEPTNVSNTTTRRRPGADLLLYLGIGLAGLAIAAYAATGLPEPWSVLALAVAALIEVVAAVGFVRREPFVALYGSMTVLAIGLIVGGPIMDSLALGVGGVVALVVVGATAPIAIGLRRMIAPAPIVTAPDGALLERIRDNTMLSDSAKRVLFRERELALLRDAIEQDIDAEAYNSALTLCTEMGEVFGYREEAEQFRSRIVASHQTRYEASAREAIEHLDALLAERNWPAAHQTAARIRRLYADSHLVGDLEWRFSNARDDHKNELVNVFLKAAESDDVERAMLLLKQLDRYLDQTEAERFTEVAQGVVVKHRENLGVQFKMAVSEHRWADAARAGESIVQEFPNTKMAEEVRSMIDVLRTRATQAAVTGVTGES